MKEQVNESVGATAGEPAYVVSRRNVKIGIFWLVGTLAVIPVSLILLVVIQIGTKGSGVSGVLQGIKMLLAFIGIAWFLVLPIGILIGLYYLRRNKIVEMLRWDERSGKGNLSEIPAEIKGFNWGAAGLTFVWGAYHSVWISLLALIPIINIVMMIVLGFKGNQWAWQKNKWESVEVFTASQNKWKPWGAAIIAITVFLNIKAFIN